MKNLSLALSVIAVIGVGILFGMQLSGNKKGGGSSAAGGSTSGNGSSKIAYVNIDSLEANYTYLKAKKDEFTKRQENMNMELQRSAQQIEADIANVQRKAEANTLTQAEYEAAQKRVAQMKLSLDTRKNAMAEQLLREQDEFNENLQKSLDAYLEEYNKDKGYDYILSYSRSGSILYKNAALDITKEVIDGMNKRVVEGDTTKKKK
jgi:outer membrane protein